ncbi:hypothetical protein DFJ58DRAFT_762772 [Suillus subalutaceus]|uniref:uncharacterized protein n=1 Tax=Suillus subalutaceus TaxID=48586 RepID=UPI001B87DC45|nr:uncharacterized protein DFJ58DRAFT_762772 [Suillus subalutaceus]KAG1871878.1 hypothetical protein DFJ58DRAFT_762772 [Suillus subalutaceus]
MLRFLVLWAVGHTGHLTARHLINWRASILSGAYLALSRMTRRRYGNEERPCSQKYNYGHHAKLSGPSCLGRSYFYAPYR